MSQSESKLYPLVYDPHIAWMLNLKNLDIGLDTALPTMDELQDLGLGGEQEKGKIIESGILDSLVALVKDSEMDYKKVMYPEWTDDIVTNKMIKDDRADYFDNRIKTQSTDILDFIDGLIKLDRYPEEMFGMYKQLHRLIEGSNNKFEMMRALNQLRIIAMSVVPPQLKFEQVQIVEQSIISSPRTMEG